MIIPIAVTIAIGAYALCSWLAYRLHIAYFTREYPSLHFSIPSKGLQYDGGATLRRDRGAARVYAILGPAALLTALALNGTRHGLSIPTEEELRGRAKQRWATDE